MDLASSLALGAVQVLGVLIDLAAIVIAVARWVRHPTVSMLVVVSMGIALVVRGGWFVVPRLMDVGGDHDAFLLVNAGLSFVSTLAFGLLVSPSVWEHHYALALPLALHALALRGHDRPLAVALSLYAMLLMPTFDLFPLSHHRLAGMLALLFIGSPRAAAAQRA